jgi:hypothetical protein
MGRAPLPITGEAVKCKALTYVHVCRSQPLDGLLNTHYQLVHLTAL